MSTSVIDNCTRGCNGYFLDGLGIRNGLMSAFLMVKGSGDVNASTKWRG